MTPREIDHAQALLELQTRRQLLALLCEGGSTAPPATLIRAEAAVKHQELEVLRFAPAS